MDVERVEALVNLMKAEGIAELTIESPDFKVSIKRELPPATGGASAAPEVAPVGPYAPQAPEGVTEAGPLAVRSPAVGRLQLAEGVAVGRVVAAGQVLAVVEAMRIPNEVRSPAAGTILEILATEGAVVEYGQPLITIEPSPEVNVHETEV
jgi:acetyl-CoA carboxylase biotin carboxyl carrier protein